MVDVVKSADLRGLFTHNRWWTTHLKVRFEMTSDKLVWPLVSRSRSRSYSSSIASKNMIISIIIFVICQQIFEWIKLDRLHLDLREFLTLDLKSNRQKLWRKSTAIKFMFEENLKGENARDRRVGRCKINEKLATVTITYCGLKVLLICFVRKPAVHYSNILGCLNRGKI